MASRGAREDRRRVGPGDEGAPRRTSLDSLPRDVLFDVFDQRRLTGNDVLRAASVCRSWREALAPVLRRRHATLVTSRARDQLDASDPSTAASPGDRWFRRFALDACVACRRARPAFDFEYRNPNPNPNPDPYPDPDPDPDVDVTLSPRHPNDPDANTTAGKTRAPPPGVAGLTARRRYCRECASLPTATEEMRAWSTVRVRPARGRGETVESRDAARDGSTR